MAKQTKRQMMDEFFNIIQSERYNQLDERLEALYDQKRITSGAWIFVYSMSQSYGYREFMKKLDKAAKAKDYFQYINCQIYSRDFEWNLKNIKEHMDKTEAFVTEQENLPFEQTQYQLLEASGELRNH